MKTNKKAYILLGAFILLLILGRFLMESYIGKTANISASTMSDLPIEFGIFTLDMNDWLESSARPGSIGQCVFAPETLSDDLMDLGLGDILRIMDDSSNTHDYTIYHAETIAANAHMADIAKYDRTLMVIADHPAREGQKYILYAHMPEEL